MPRLKLKWAFGIPHGMTNNAQPTVVSGRVFMATDNGYIYSLDAKTGCVYWSFQNGSIVRNSPMVGAVRGQGGAQWAVFFGDGHANVFALDAQTGRQLWKVRVDDHVVARITGRREVSRRRVYVPISGSEEFTAGHKDYPCCTARGGVAALDANTGKQIWKTYTADEPKPWKKNPNGVQLYGPSAGGVWNAPTIDPVRGALYVGTGDAVTPPESPLSDAVMALDLKTGKVLWSRRATEDDLFMGGCAGPNKGEQCPSTMGPDYDIGNSPILMTLPNGKRALFVGTKGADVLALDPDANGARPVPGESRPASRSASRDAAAAGSCGAAPRTAGRSTTAWAPRASARCEQPTARRRWVFTPGAGAATSLGAAPTAIPGVVFEGAGDGRLFAVSAGDGKQLWEFNTAQPFETVNKVPGEGRRRSPSSGAVIVDGMVYIGSGYAICAGASGGNVLLAFGVE